MKKVILCCSFIFLFCYQMSANSLDSDIKNYVDHFLQNSFNILNSKNLDTKEKESKVSNLLLENLHFEWIVNFLLGAEIHRISNEELEKFQEVYKNYITYNLGKMIKQYEGEKVEIKFVKNIKDKDYLVKTQVISNNESGNIVVDIMVRKVDSNVFKIFDIITEGISLLITEKQDFNIILQDPKLGKEKVKKLISKLSGEE